jgi:hypothetical protein
MLFHFPYPDGISRQDAPVWLTHNIPSSRRRLSWAGRPGRPSAARNSGATADHSRSVKSPRRTFPISLPARNFVANGGKPRSADRLGGLLPDVEPRRCLRFDAVERSANSCLRSRNPSRRSVGRSKSQTPVACHRRYVWRTASGSPYRRGMSRHDAPRRATHNIPFRITTDSSDSNCSWIGS